MPVNYNQLIDGIGSLIAQSKQHIATTINTTLVQTYWQIGRHIVEFEQNGNNRAAYGKSLIQQLSRDLTLRYGKGFGKSNLLYMRKLYITFQKSGTLSHLLTWSHYYEILKSDEPLEIGFYVKQCENERWTVRELKRQMKSMLFHRLALSTDKEGILELAHKGVQVQKPEDVIRDPMVLDFLGLPQQKKYSEKKLENAIVDNLTSFLLELGKGLSNPGTMLVSRNQYYKGGESVCRNKALQTMFSMLGKAEKAGSGVDKILQGWKDNHWSRPEIDTSIRPDKVDLMLDISDLIKMSDQVTDQASNQVNDTENQEYNTKTAKFADQASDQAADQVSDQAEKLCDSVADAIVEFCKTPRTIKQIMSHLKMNNRTYMRNTYITPLLGKRLRLTIPDKPTHPRQMYVSI